MSRPLRLEYPEAIYHITSRGNARADIFLDDSDRELFLSILADAVDR
jgi:REP element-mobilizing transposase RayT